MREQSTAGPTAVAPCSARRVTTAMTSGVGVPGDARMFAIAEEILVEADEPYGLQGGGGGGESAWLAGGRAESLNKWENSSAPD